MFVQRNGCIERADNARGGARGTRESDASARRGVHLWTSIRLYADTTPGNASSTRNRGGGAKLKQSRGLQALFRNQASRALCNLLQLRFCTHPAGAAALAHRARAPRRPGHAAPRRRKGGKKIFAEVPRTNRFQHDLRKTAQLCATARASASPAIPLNSCRNASANRSGSASVLVSVAHTGSTFSNSGFSSLTAKAATMSHTARSPA